MTPDDGLIGSSLIEQRDDLLLLLLLYQLRQLQVQVKSVMEEEQPDYEEGT